MQLPKNMRLSKYTITKEWLLWIDNSLLWKTWAVLMIWWESIDSDTQNNIYDSISVAKTALQVLRKQQKIQTRFWTKLTGIKIKLCWEAKRRINWLSYAILSDKEQEKRIKKALIELWTKKEEMALIEFESLKDDQNILSLLELSAQNNESENNDYNCLLKAFEVNERFKNSVLRSVPQKIKDLWIQSQVKNYALVQLITMINEFEKWNWIKVWYEREDLYDEIFASILNWSYPELIWITNRLNQEHRKPSELFKTIRWTSDFAKKARETYRLNQSVKKLRWMALWIWLSIASAIPWWILLDRQLIRIEETQNIEEARMKFGNTLKKRLVDKSENEFMDKAYWRNRWDAKYWFWPEWYRWKDSWKAYAESLSFWVVDRLSKYIEKNNIKTPTDNQYDENHITSRVLTQMEYELFKNIIFEVLLNIPEEFRQYIWWWSFNSVIVEYLINNPKFQYFFHEFTDQNIKDIDPKDIFREYHIYTDEELREWGHDISKLRKQWY